MKINIDKYQYQVRFSEEDVCFIATVTEFPYLTADGSTQAVALEELRAVVTDAVDILESEDKKVPDPISEREYKGNISLRLLPETHRQLAERARVAGCSLNQFLTSLIEKNMSADSIERATNRMERVAAELEALRSSGMFFPDIYNLASPKLGTGTKLGTWLSLSNDMYVSSEQRI